MRDRFINGIIAGVVGSLGKDSLDLLSYGLFRTTRYLDFAGVFIYGNKPTFWWDSILAFLVEIIFACNLTILFIYLLPYLNLYRYYRNHFRVFNLAHRN